MAITLSAFTLIPYALVLLQLRVFYAREQPWTPIVLIVVITAVKIAASLAAPHLTDDPELVAGYLGLANGLGFLAGAIVGYILLRANLNPPGGRLISLEVVRTILVTIAASLLAGLIAHVVDQLLGLESLTRTAAGGFDAAAAGARADHAADHRAVSAGRPGARRAGRRAAPSGAGSAGPTAVAEPPAAPGPDRPRPGGPSRTLIRGIRSRHGRVKRRGAAGAGLRQGCRSRDAERTSGDRRLRGRLRRPTTTARRPASRGRPSTTSSPTCPRESASAAVGPAARRLRRRPHP